MWPYWNTEFSWLLINTKLPLLEVKKLTVKPWKQSEEYSLQSTEMMRS